MTTPIHDAAARATGFRPGRANRKTAPQPALTAPVPETVQNRAEPPATAMEETMSPVTAALAAVQHQAAALERDVAANPLAVMIAERRIGCDLSQAECFAVAGLIAAMEAEKRAQDDSRARASAAVAASANGSGPQRVIA